MCDYIDDLINFLSRGEYLQALEYFYSYDYQFLDVSIFELSIPFINKIFKNAVHESENEIIGSSGFIIKYSEITKDSNLKFIRSNLNKFKSITEKFVEYGLIKNISVCIFFIHMLKDFFCIEKETNCADYILTLVIKLIINDNNMLALYLMRAFSMLEEKDSTIYFNANNDYGGIETIPIYMLSCIKCDCLLSKYFLGCLPKFLDIKLEENKQKLFDTIRFILKINKSNVFSFSSSLFSYDHLYYTIIKLPQFLTFLVDHEVYDIFYVLSTKENNIDCIKNSQAYKSSKLPRTKSAKMV